MRDTPGHPRFPRFPNSVETLRSRQGFPRKGDEKHGFVLSPERV